MSQWWDTCTITIKFFAGSKQVVIRCVRVVFGVLLVDDLGICVRESVEKQWNED
jgi:hypothetical protein